VNGRIHEGQGFIHILQVFTKYDNTDILDQITLAPFSTMKISLEYQNYNIFVLALKDLVNGIYGLFFYAGTNQNRFLLVAEHTQKDITSQHQKYLHFAALSIYFCE